MISSYRIQCMWKPDKDPTANRGSLQRGQFRMPGGRGGGGGGRGEGGGGSSSSCGFGSTGLRRDGGEGGGGLGGIGAKAREEGYRVIAGLTLYKVRLRCQQMQCIPCEGFSGSGNVLCCEAAYFLFLLLYCRAAWFFPRLGLWETPPLENLLLRLTEKLLYSVITLFISSVD